MIKTLIDPKEIPVIEEAKDGYFAVYDSGDRIWNPNKMSFNNIKEIEKKYDMGGGGWINLEEGENRIRIVSDCVDYGDHYINGKFTICVGKEECKFCQVGNKPSVKFLAWAIDRKDGGLKLFRFGYKIYKQIVAYKTNEDYAFEFTPSYDIVINKVGTGKASEYTVVPARKDTDLTAEENVMVGKKAKDPQEVIDRMKQKVLEATGGMEAEGEASEEE